MRLTVRTNLAMRTLMFCSINDERLVRKSEVAEACNASENHLGVVINLLGQYGFIETVRGRHGGIRLQRAADQISVGAVFRIFEAGVPFTECFDQTNNTCPLTFECRLRGALGDAIDAFYGALEKLTLADLVRDNSGLSSLLERPGREAEARLITANGHVSGSSHGHANGTANGHPHGLADSHALSGMSHDQNGHEAPVAHDAANLVSHGATAHVRGG